MEATTWPASRQYEDRAVTWDKKFEQRRRDAYGAEDKKLRPRSDQSKITAFLEQQGTNLDHWDFAYTALRDYIVSEKEELLQRKSPPTSDDTPLALLDDRRDTQQGEHSARNWQEYESNPPIGRNVAVLTLDAGDLYRRLLTKRENKAERRVMCDSRSSPYKDLLIRVARYFPNITRLGVLAMVLTVSVLQGPMLRDFLQRYLSYRVFFGVSMPRGFVMEAHIPYFALRRSLQPMKDQRELRRHGSFLPDRFKPRVPEYLYEAQISILVTGIDEWVWTAYCFTDTFFENAESVKSYSTKRLDAPTGGEMLIDDPVWNPREYFIRILSRRIMQVTKEWGSVVSTLEARLGKFEEGIFNGTEGITFGDDESFTRTKDNTQTVQLLRLLNNSLVKTIDSWERFGAGEIRCFHLGHHESSRTRWNGYLAAIEKDVTELQFLSKSLQQRIDMFDHLRDGLVNASQLVETRVSSDQNKSIGRLTWVTVIYLPLSLATGIFSMSIIPKGVPWVAYGTLIVTLSLITLASAGMLPRLWREVSRIWQDIPLIWRKVQDDIWPSLLEAWKRHFRPLRYSTLL